MNNKQKAAEAGQIMIDYANGATVEQREKSSGTPWQVEDNPNFNWSRYRYRIAAKLESYWNICTAEDVYAVYPTEAEALKNLHKWAKYGAYVQESKPVGNPVGNQ